MNAITAWRPCPLPAAFGRGFCPGQTGRKPALLCPALWLFGPSGVQALRNVHWTFRSAFGGPGFHRSSLEKPNRWLFLAFGQHSSLPRPAMPSGFCPSTARFARAQDEGTKVGSGAQGRASLIYNTWREPCAPPVFLPPLQVPPFAGGYTSAGARDSDESVQPRTVMRPSRHRRFPSIPGAHRVSRESAREE